LTPVNPVVVAGATVAFTVQATGAAPLAFNWYRNGAFIARTLTNRFQLINVQTNQAGAYFVIVTNRYGIARSSDSLLTVQDAIQTDSPPRIDSPLAVITSNAVVSSDTGLTITASGSSPLSYQWYWNGVLLPGATNAHLSLPNVQLNQQG